MSDRPPPFIIAIDGPAASGKGTLARRLASVLGFAHLDTGLLYRAVALAMMQRGTDPEDRQGAARIARDLARTATEQDDPSLRHERTGRLAGRIAAYPEVREALRRYQQDFASCPPGGTPGAVLDGRDIGTVISPNADVKLYIDADPQQRLHRRVQELRDRGEESTLDSVLTEMRERDKRDRTRGVAPLLPAADAIVIDSTHLGADAVFSKAMNIIRPRTLERHRSVKQEPTNT